MKTKFIYVAIFLLFISFVSADYGSYECLYLNGDGNFRGNVIGNVTINGAGVIQVKNYDTLETTGNWTMNWLGDWLLLTGEGTIFVDNWITKDGLTIMAGGSGEVTINGFYDIRVDGFGFKRIDC